MGAVALTSCAKEWSFHPELSAATKAMTEASWKKGPERYPEAVGAYSTLNPAYGTSPPYVQTRSHFSTQLLVHTEMQWSQE